MNNKILALLVSAVMVMVAWVAAVSVPSAEGEGDGSEKTPWMLMGNVALEYQMELADPSVNLEMDFNQIAFGAGDDDQTITIEWAASTNTYGTAGEFTDFNLIYSDAGAPAAGYVSVYPAGASEANVCISFSLDPRMDGEGSDAQKVRGIYDLTVDAKKETDPVYFLFKVTVLGNYGDNFGEHPSYYYYGIHVSVVDERGDATVVLSSNGHDQTVSSVFTEYNDDTAGDETTPATYSVLEIPKDTELEKVYAYVNLLDNYDYEDFDFFAEGLPAGIAMKIDGVITGKVAVTVSANEENEFKVFAVHKENPGNVLPATFIWKVVAGEDEFEYTVGDVTKPSSEPSYKVMDNTDDTVTISWTKEGSETYKVYLTTADGEKTDITPDSGTSVVIGEVDDEGNGYSLEGITGIIQVTIDRTPADGTEVDATAVIHILVVGPVVHSGLQPVVTAI